MKTQTIKFNDFMTGEHRKPKNKAKVQKAVKLASGLALPLALGSPIGLALGVTKVFANVNESVPVVAAVPVGAKEWMGETTISTLAHALDPVIDILVVLSFPIASVIIVGACFFFMFGNPEKAWGMIQNAGLGYVLIQVSPVILNVLKQVGNAV